MTSKDYELVTLTIRGRVKNAEAMHAFGYRQEEKKLATDVLADLVYFLARELWINNKAFSQSKFLEDCGIEEQSTEAPQEDDNIIDRSK